MKLLKFNSDSQESKTALDIEVCTTFNDQDWLWLY